MFNYLFDQQNFYFSTEFSKILCFTILLCFRYVDSTNKIISIDKTTDTALNNKIESIVTKFRIDISKDIKLKSIIPIYVRNII